MNLTACRPDDSSLLADITWCVAQFINVSAAGLRISLD